MSEKETDGVPMSVRVCERERDIQSERYKETDGERVSLCVWI